MLRIAVIDDDAKFQEQIKRYIERSFQFDASAFCVSCYQNGVDFLSEYKGNFDIVIIDIMMPLMNGLEVAHKLREYDKNVLVLFITMTADFAIRGYEVSAIDYILKPLSYEKDFKYKFERVIKMALEQNQRKKEIVLKDENGRLVKLDVDELIYVLKDKDKAMYYTKQGTFAQRITISKVKESLNGTEAFAAANSGCLVNMAFIHNAKGSTIEMQDGTKLALSRGKKKEFYEKFFGYIDR